MKASMSCFNGMIVAALVGASALPVWAVDDFSFVAPDTLKNAAWVEEGRVIAAVDPVESNATRCIDFAVVASNLCPRMAFAPDAVGALIPTRFDDGSVGFCGWGDGAWHELPCADVETNVTLNCRIELKTVGGTRYVGYRVKGEGEGGQWNALVSRTGREWFETAHESLNTQAGVTEDAALGSVVATSEAMTEPSATFRWIGGASGKWSDPNNWGTARAPGLAGDLAMVSGDVVIDGVATRDLVVAYGEDGVGTAMGGRIRGEVTLDTTRPRAGKTMAATVPTLFGRTSDYELVWKRGSWAKDYGHYAEGASITPDADDYEHWYKLVATEDGTNTVFEKEFYFSKLPVIYLTTDDGAFPSTKKEEHAGTIVCQGGEGYKAIRFNDEESGKMSVKLRGNSTLGYAKKAFKVKLDKKTDMFGMGKQKHWVMLANYNDLANQRNKLAYDLANDIGSLGMDSTWVQCVFNGEFLGLYQFGEHIRIDKNRVNIRDWEGIVEDEKHGTAEDLSVIDPEEYDIAGSYLMEFSSEGDEVTTWTTRSGKLEMISMANKPEYLNTNSNMYEFVRNFMQEYWDACTSSNRVNAKTGKSYKDYSDLDSMALYTIVNELFTNQDACKKSRYAYINDPEEGGKLLWGPVWDFDWGSESVRVGDDSKNWVTVGQSAKETSTQKAYAKKYSMMKEWFSDSDFCRRIHALYWKHRARFGEIVAEGGKIDRNEAYIAEAAEADDAKWWTNRKGWNRTSAEDTAILKANLVKRLAWLDEQFKTPKTIHDSVEKFAKEIQSAPQDYVPLGIRFLVY